MSKLVAGTLPKVTLVAPVKPVPVMVTVVPPAVGPDVGVIPVSVGTGVFAALVLGAWVVDVSAWGELEHPVITAAETATSSNGFRRPRDLHPVPHCLCFIVRVSHSPDRRAILW
jgi:hypothetical protein